MGNIVLKCNKCGRFYVGGNHEDIGKPDNFKSCGGIMADTGIMFDEYLLISKISQDKTFLNAMVTLKQNDIIEYNLKLSQFKTQANQQASITQSNKIKCPTCNSTNVKRISTGAKVAGAVAFGLLSKTAKSQFECLNCKYKW